MKYILFAFLGIFSLGINAQNSTSFSAQKISFSEVNSVRVEQHSGSQIEFSYGGKECRGLGDVGDEQAERDERSQGLVAINSMGMRDNTGLGLHTKMEGNELKVFQISSNNEHCYLVKVPSGTSVYYEHSTHHGENIQLANLDGEVEVTAKFNDIHFENMTGAITLNSIHGSIEGNFTNVNQNNPISIHSVHDIVDITVPAATKANFRLESRWGDIFTDLDIKVPAKEGLQKMGGNDISGTYNGGGVDITIKSSHDNIYLRKG